jgi:hypothetical protein
MLRYKGEGLKQQRFRRPSGWFLSKRFHPVMTASSLLPYRSTLLFIFQFIGIRSGRLKYPQILNTSPTTIVIKVYKQNIFIIYKE